MSILPKLLKSNQLAGWLGQGVVSSHQFCGAADGRPLGRRRAARILCTRLLHSGRWPWRRRMRLSHAPMPSSSSSPPAGRKPMLWHAGIRLRTFLADRGGLAAASWLITLRRETPSSRPFSHPWLMIPWFCSRDFARRFSFANLRMQQRWPSTCLASLLALALLGAAAVTGRLDAVTAMICLGLAGGIVGTAWLIVRRKSFTRTPAPSPPQRSRAGLSESGCIEPADAPASGYAAHWIILILAGAQSPRLFRLCQRRGAGHPFLFGLFNMLTPKYVRRVAMAGTARCAARP